MESRGVIGFLPRDLRDLDFGDIHSDIRPADIRTNDRIVARIRKRAHENSDYVQLRVWRLSPLGVELLQPAGETRLSRGDPVDLEIVLAGQRATFQGLVVDLVQRKDEQEIIGIRLSRRDSGETVSTNRRKAVRWLCSDEFFPTCMAPTPGRFDDFIYFQIRDISHDGLQLVCSLRNKFLIPGMGLSLTAVFPFGSVVSIRIELTRVGITSIGGRDRLVVGSKYVELSAYAKQALGQYLIQFSNVDSLEALREAGLAPKSLALGVDFYNLKNEEDYLEVLELRRLAHTLDQNLKREVTALEMGDINDARARIVIGKYRGRVVATARIRYNEMDQPMEHEAHVPWPKELPRRDQIIEISRVATHPDFRRNDLLAALIRHICDNVIQSDRPWLIFSCLDKMIPFYEKLGFRQTGLRHTEPIWKEDRVLNVMVVNILDMVVGRNVNPFYWNVVWRQVANLLVEQNVIRLTGMDKVRMLVYKAVAPVVDFIYYFKKPGRNARPNNREASR